MAARAAYRRLFHKQPPAEQAEEVKVIVKRDIVAARLAYFRMLHNHARKTGNYIGNTCYGRSSKSPMRVARERRAQVEERLNHMFRSWEFGQRFLVKVEDVTRALVVSQ